MSSLTLKCRFFEGKYAFQVGDNPEMKHDRAATEKMIAAIAMPGMKATMQALVSNAEARPGQWVFLSSEDQPK